MLLCHVCLVSPGTDDEPAYHGLSRGGIELELYPGALFSIYGPDPTTIPKVTAEAKAGRKLSASGWRLPVIRAAVEEQKAVVPAQPKGAAPKFGDGVNLVQTSEWVNATVKGYNVPTDYTTYACNVSPSSWHSAGNPTVLAAKSSYCACHLLTDLRGFVTHSKCKREASNAERAREVTPLHFDFVGDVSCTCAQVYDVVLPKKTHTIEFGPILNSTNPETLHHFVIYACL